VLVLFDIDQTLVDTQGAGVGALRDAALEVFGKAFTSDGVSFAGRIDPLILAELLRANGVEPSEANAAALRHAYAQRLENALEGRCLSLPGTHELVDALERIERLTLGVLTGNYAETGRVKLRAAGLDPDRFVVQAWGGDSPHWPPAREHLPHVAMARYREAIGESVKPALVTIIGDTPHDVACALSAGCRALGVATGFSSAGDLREAGAHLVVKDLSATEEIMRWLLNGKA